MLSESGGEQGISAQEDLPEVSKSAYKALTALKIHTC